MSPVSIFSRPCLRALAGAALVLAGPLASAQITITPANTNLTQGGTRVFTAVRSDNLNPDWAWSLEGAPPDATINPHTGHFMAPAQVAQPLTYCVRVTDLAHPGTFARTNVRVIPGRAIITTVEASWAVLHHDQRVTLLASRGDEEQPNWSWSILEPEGGRLIPAFQGGGMVYVPPRVAHSMVFTVRVEDLAHPGDGHSQRFNVVPAMVRVDRIDSADHANPPLRSGQTCPLQARRHDRQALPWVWSVLEPLGGAIHPQGPGFAQYTAPRVATTRTFHIQATSGADRGSVLPIKVLPTITLKPATSTHVLSGNVCVIEASHPAPAGAVTWVWRVLDSEDPRPSRDTSGGYLPNAYGFRAPQVGWPTTYTLQAADSRHPEDPARIQIQVLPRFEGLDPSSDIVFQNLMPNVMGADWLAPVPQATLFAGYPGVYTRSRPKLFNHINCIAYVDADPAMGFLSEKWLVGDNSGIKVVSPQGQVHALLQVFGRVTAIAIRPRGNAPGTFERVAYATEVDWNEPRSMISILAKGPIPRVLAGTLARVHPGARLLVGRGPAVAFDRIYYLAWTAESNLRVMDSDQEGANVRSVALDGTVTALTKREDELMAATWDPASGRAFCIDDATIFEEHWPVIVAPQLGSASMAGSPALPVSIRAPLVQGMQDPVALQVLGNFMFIADRANAQLEMFNLQTHELHTLVGHPTQGNTRLGPLGFGSPGLPPQACASLHEPRVFFVRDDGQCLMAQDDALIHLDLSTFALPPVEHLLPEPMALVGPEAEGPADPAPGSKRDVPDDPDSPRRVRQRHDHSGGGPAALPQ
jgi:hypothetical protein